MRILIGIAYLITLAPAWAAFTFVTAPPAEQITHTGARILVSTSVVTNATLMWDTVSHCSATGNCSGPTYSNACQGYANADSPSGPSATYSVHNWFVNGAPPSTTVYFAWSATDGSTSGCSQEQSFTTLPLPVPHPALAALPGSGGGSPITSPPTPPSPSGTTRIVGTSTGCTDLMQCWQTSNCGDTIELPAGVTPNNGAVGYFQLLPAKTCTSSTQLLITTTAAANLPPVGVRVDPTYKNVLATVEGSGFFHYNLGNSGGIGASTGDSATPSNGNCYPGAYAWVLASNPGSPSFNMQQCQPAGPVVSIAGMTGCAYNASIGNTYNCAVTTSSEDGFSASDHLYVSGVLGVPTANGSCQVQAITSTTQFTMECAATYYNQTQYSYAGGGTVQHYTWVTVTPQSVSLNSLPSSCSPLGAWGYDSSQATINYGPFPWPNNGSLYGGATGAYNSTGSVVRCVAAENGSGNVWRTWTVFMNTPIQTGCCTGYYGSYVNGQVSPVAIDLSGSSWIYVRGLHLTNVPIPPDPNFTHDAGNQLNGLVNFQGGKMAEPYLVTSVQDSVHPATSSNITFDQVWIDCPDYSSSTNQGAIQNAAVLNGNNIAFINSYVGPGCAPWIGAFDRGHRYDNYASAAIIRNAGQGFVFDNNYCQCDGIGLHHDDSETALIQNQDITTTRNTFYRSPTHFYGHPSSNGVYYPFRQLYEHKQGQRVLIQGNQFINNWRNVSQGAAIALTPRMDSSPWLAYYATVTVSGSVSTITEPNIPNLNLTAGEWLACNPSGVQQLFQVAANSVGNTVTVNQVMPTGSYQCVLVDWPYGLEDVTIAYNTFQDLPDGISMFPTVNQDIAAVPAYVVSPFARLTMHDNVYNGILDDDPVGAATPGTSGDPNIWQGSGGGFVFYDAWPMATDYISNHETHYSIGGITGVVFSSSSYVNPRPFLKNNEGIYITNNISSMRAPSTCVTPANCGQLSLAVGPINDSGIANYGTAMMNACCVNSLLANNLYEMTGGNPGGYPSSIAWASTPGDLGLRNANAPTGFVPLVPAPIDLGLVSTSRAISANRLSTDGLSLGANWEALQAAEGVVTNVRALTGTASATISFFAPDTYGCSVDYGTDPTFATFTRLPNAGGERSQSVTFATSPNATYYYRINCQTQQPTGSFVAQY